jgi:hypothetical protein
MPYENYYENGKMPMWEHEVFHHKLYFNFKYYFFNFWVSNSYMFI